MPHITEYLDEKKMAQMFIRSYLFLVDDVHVSVTYCVREELIRRWVADELPVLSTQAEPGEPVNLQTLKCRSEAC